jgi:alpha-tubulin suppressor-like RCC1 family protein
VHRSSPLRAVTLALATSGLAACGGISDPPGDQVEVTLDISLLSAGFLTCLTDCNVSELETVELGPEILAARYSCNEAGESFEVDFVIGTALVERRTFPCQPEGSQVTAGIVSTAAAWVPSDSGNYTLQIFADPRNVLGETDETNNQATHEFIVRFPEPALVSAGPNSTCATWSGGRAYCWGANAVGQLGIGSTVSTRSPWAVSGDPSYFSVSETYGTHRCGMAMFAQGLPPECWGSNESGQLGNGTLTSSLSPQVVTTQRMLIPVAAGASHTCGLWDRDELYCWGDNSLGQLGTGGTPATSETPVLVPVPGYSTVVAGARHTCALDGAGAAWCWGSNQFGQLGTGATGGTETSPTAVTGGLQFSRLAAGAFHTCGVTTTGTTACWGANESGQLGSAAGETCLDDGAASVACRSTPATVSGGHAFVVVYAGWAHSCGILATGAAYCWGNGADGQLGNGATLNSQDPVAVSLGLAFNHVSLGGGHTCGLADDRFYCWGKNDDGQLGIGTNDPSSVPVRVDDPFWGAN